MPSRSTEHFVTLFDSAFLPMGLALYRSLLEHAHPFCLWILCMDDEVHRQLTRLALPRVNLIPLAEVESESLLAVKPGRSRGEYCWTLTPFTFEAVFERDSAVQQVTYLDSDLFFFDDPRLLLDELEQSGKEVLITEHAYPPGCQRAEELNGRFCVQFLTFRRTAPSFKVMHWWQEKCVEWCFARFEDGRFGDQKYLDRWPELFAPEVHVVRQREKTLAPWNVEHLENTLNLPLNPVFYHFHGLRLVSPERMRLYFGYRVGRQGLALYERYCEVLKGCCVAIVGAGFPVRYLRETDPLYLKMWHRLKGRYGEKSLP